MKYYHERWWKAAVSNVNQQGACASSLHFQVGWL